MQLIIAMFTEAPHNPVAAFLAGYIVIVGGMGVYVCVRKVVRKITNS